MICRISNLDVPAAALDASRGVRDLRAHGGGEESTRLWRPDDVYRVGSITSAGAVTSSLRVSHCCGLSLQLHARGASSSSIGLPSATNEATRPRWYGEWLTDSRRSHTVFVRSVRSAQCGAAVAALPSPKCVTRPPRPIPFRVGFTEEGVQRELWQPGDAMPKKTLQCFVSILRVL